MARNEHLTRVELIDPALHDRGWTEAHIREEKTPGGVDIVNGRPRKRRGRTDYLLCLPVLPGKPPLPVAVLEAKAEGKLDSLGIQQARDYASRFHTPFVFSTNGLLSTEYGEDTQHIVDARPLGAFPTPDDLRRRYEMLRSIQLAADAALPLFMPYKGGEQARWYFQDAAIRAVLERIAAGQRKLLLSLATGTGKTVIASQLLWKEAQAGRLKGHALFVCDRDELRTQGMGKLHAIFGDNAQEVSTDDPRRNARVLVATYQTLNIAEEDGEPLFWKENYPPGFFSHIVIDECHRSAWGKWSVVLKDNPEAIQIGLTATPRIVVGGKKGSEGRTKDEEITAHNIEYFGQPVYEYSIGAAQHDGYLAACEVIRRAVDLDKQEITKEDIQQRSAVDAYTGRPVRPGEIEDRYTAHDYEVKLMLDDRVKAMCADLFDHLLATGGPHQKTVVFCARDSHANQVMIALNNLYADWCKRVRRTPKEWYAFQCTGNPDLRPAARDLIPDLRGAKNSHFIATTVELLSTGVDIPNLANVVFFRYLESPISFYQMVGRGTRIGEPRGSKEMFHLYDYTNSTRLFGEEFISRARPTPPTDEGGGGDVGDPAMGGEDGGGGGQKPQRKIIRVGEHKFTVQVQGAGRAILCEEEDKDVLVPLEEYKRQLAVRLVEEAPTIEALRARWIVPDLRQSLLTALPGGEGAVRLVRELEDEQECDLFDVLAELGYGLPPKSRPERVAAFGYKNKQWLKNFPERTGLTIANMARQFERNGIEELEISNLFDVPGVDFGALTGLPVPPNELVQQTKERLLA